jgi:hypothetical protein
MNEIPVNAKVELLPGRDEVYQFAQSGSRGWARKTTVDELGFPMIYVEWDKDHWKYNGEEDGWTFESHFKMIEEPPTPPASVATELIQQAQARRDEERCQHCGEEHGADVQKASEFLAILEKATQAAAAAEGFFVVTISPEYDPALPGVAIYRPKIFTGLMTDDAADMIEAQVVHLATLAHNEMIEKRMKKREQG